MCGQSPTPINCQETMVLQVHVSQRLSKMQNASVFTEKGQNRFRTFSVLFSKVRTGPEGKFPEFLIFFVFFSSFAPNFVPNIPRCFKGLFVLCFQGGVILKPQPPHARQKYEQSYGSPKCQVCLVLKHLGSYLVQIFCSYFCLVWWGGGSPAHF